MHLHLSPAPRPDAPRPDSPFWADSPFWPDSPFRPDRTARLAVTVRENVAERLDRTARPPAAVRPLLALSLEASDLVDETILLPWLVDTAAQFGADHIGRRLLDNREAKFLQSSQYRRLTSSGRSSEHVPFRGRAAH
jgi:hypothetical protein